MKLQLHLTAWLFPGLLGAGAIFTVALLGGALAGDHRQASPAAERLAAPSEARLASEELLEPDVVEGTL